MAYMPVKDAAGNTVHIRTNGAGTSGDPYVMAPAMTLADGASVVDGAVADAAATAGGTGTVSAKLRRITQGLEDLKTLIVLAAGSSIIGKVGIDQTTSGTTNAVVPIASTGGGATPYSFISTAAVQAAAIKASAGQVYEMQFFNVTASAKYVRLYNQTGSPVAGDTANIVWRGVIPGDTTGAGFIVQFTRGMVFSSGIGIRVTAAVADNDKTAMGANEILGNVLYK